MHNKIKKAHTCKQAFGPELIRVLNSQPTGEIIIYLTVGCQYFLPDPWYLPSQRALQPSGQYKVVLLVWRLYCASYSWYWQNLLEKPTEREYYTDNAVAMVQCKVLKQLQLLEGRKIDDQDIVDDVNFLNETLQASVQDLRLW